MTSIKSLAAPEKTVTMDYPGHDGFKVQIAFLGREGLNKLRKKCTHTKYDKRTRQPIDTIDEDKFAEEYIKATIKGWEGLTIGILEELMPTVENHGLDKDTEIEYTEENAQELMESSDYFDSWVSNQVTELENFTKGK